MDGYTEALPVFCSVPFMFLHVFFWLYNLNIKHRKLYYWPVRTELCDKQLLLTIHPECDHPLPDKFLPLPSGICDRRPEKRSNSYKQSFIPAAIKELNKTYCSLHVHVRSAWLCLMSSCEQTVVSFAVFSCITSVLVLFYLLCNNFPLGLINN